MHLRPCIPPLISADRHRLPASYMEMGWKEQTSMKFNVQYA